MKTHLLFLIVALVVAGLSCSIPSRILPPEPEEGYPIITSQTVTPSGGSKYSAMLTISPSIISFDLLCFLHYYDQQEEAHSQLVYNRMQMEPSTTDVVVNFEFSLPLISDAPPRNTSLSCILSDRDTDEDLYIMETPFSIPEPAGQVTETHTETPVPILPSPATQTPTSGPVQVQLVNPGFEQGFIGWNEDPATFEYGGQSVEGTDANHSGQRSRKLFLRWGGSHILQRVVTNLITGSQITLTTWIMMPFPGDRDNKWFVLELWAGSSDGHQEILGAIDQINALPNWSQLSIGPITSDFPIAWLEVHARTTAGGGTYHDYDKPVWVDDFKLSVKSP